MLISVKGIATSVGFGQTITAVRANAGTYVNGVYQQGRTSQITMSASVQPVGSKDLRFLPEGQSTDQLMKFITTEQLKTADESEANIADVISWDNLTWRVISVQNWKSHGYFRNVAEQIHVN